MKKVVLFAVAAIFMFATSGFVTSRVQGRSQKLVKRPNAIPNRYIVVLDQNVVGSNIAEPTVESNAQYLANIYGGKVDTVYSSALKGYSVEMSPTEAENLSSDTSVSFVEQDSVISIASTQSNPGWNLDRVDQRNMPWCGSKRTRSAFGAFQCSLSETSVEGRKLPLSVL